MTATETKPLTKKARREAEKAEAAANLRKLLKPGDTVYTVLRHVSTSGMSRRIDLYIVRKGEPRYITYWVGILCDYKRSDKGGLVVGGCGMDMGFHLVYSLGYALWPNGVPCCGEKCRSNEHTNGDRNREKHTKAKPHMHRDGGYSLRHSWI